MMHNDLLSPPFIGGYCLLLEPLTICDFSTYLNYYLSTKCESKYVGASNTFDATWFSQNLKYLNYVGYNSDLLLAIACLTKQSKLIRFDWIKHKGHI